MSEFNLTGTIKVLNDMQTFDSGFKKREFVITTSGDYPQDIKFEAMKENAEKLANFKVGDTMEVHFNIRGNEYNDKYYVNLVAWRMMKTTGSTFEGIKQENPNQLNGEMAEDFNDGQRRLMNEQQDDLPF